MIRSFSRVVTHKRWTKVARRADCGSLNSLFHEAFKRVVVQPGSTAIKSCGADYEINVGGRLLIVVSSEPVAALSAARLEKVMAEGRKARDAGKFNRFRFIVQADNAAEAGKELLRAFEGLATKDEKTHLHVIPRQEVPDFFESRGQ